MLTITLANLKGGTGKTSIAVNLAAGLALSVLMRRGRVLLADLDGQGNATEWLLGKKPDVNTPGAADALLGELPEGAIVPVPNLPNLSLLPGTSALGTANIALGSRRGQREGLREALASTKPDVVVLDTPPSNSMILLSALAVTDILLMPVLPGVFSVSGLAELLNLAESICPKAIRGVILFAVRQTAAADETRDFLSKQFGQDLFKAEIRISSPATMLPAKQTTVYTHASADPRGAEDYDALMAEVRGRYFERKRKES